MSNEINFREYDEFLSNCLVECVSRFKQTSGPIVIQNMDDKIPSLLCYKVFSIYCVWAQRPLLIEAPLLTRFKLKKKIGKFSIHKKRDRDVNFFDTKNALDFFKRPLEITNKNYDYLSEVYHAYN